MNSKVLIVTPVYYREQKVKNFLSSIFYSNYSGLEIKLVIVINECNDALRSYIKNYAENFNKINGEDTCHIIEYPKNVGKGKAINDGVDMYAQEFNPDYLCSIDSDMVFVDVDWLKELVNTFPEYDSHYKNKKTVPPLGLVSPYQITDDAVSQSVHRLTNGFNIIAGKYSCWTSASNQGIAGGCFLIRYELFKRIGGYHTKTYIGGNDAHILGELHRMGYKAVVNRTVNSIHPKDTDTEKEYMKWKRDMTNAFITKQTTVNDYEGTKLF